MSGWRGFVGRLVGVPPLPAGWPGRLDGGEDVVAVGALSGGGHLVLTQLGVWVPEPPGGARRVGWERVSKAVWDRSAVLLTEAVVEDVAGAAEVLRDLPVRRWVLTDPGRVPEQLRERVTRSIRTSQHRDVPGGGAWFVQRKVPGRDGVVLQVRPDPGTPADAVRAVAAEVAERLAQVRREV